MIGRAVLLLLAVVLLFAIVGKWSTRLPPRRSGPKVESARKCPACDAYVLGSRPTPCERTDCPFRRAG